MPAPAGAVNAFVAGADPAWFEFLSAQRDVDEVNFWMPNRWGARFGVLRRGEPLLFKLRAPYNRIAGGGFFEHCTELPISLAWEAFGPKNGAASLAQVRQSTAKLRREQARPWEDYTIGCILLVEPFFWPEEAWLPAPEDWASTIGGSSPPSPVGKLKPRGCLRLVGASDPSRFEVEKYPPSSAEPAPGRP